MVSKTESYLITKCDPFPISLQGTIHIKNWKPLTFDTITESPNATLDEILGDLTSVTTLRIRLCR